MNFPSTTAAFTLSPARDGLRHLVLTRPGTKPSMRFLSVGSNSFDGIPRQVEQSEKQFKCQGKIYCSEMTSCEEATFYQRNYPGTKMDRDRDGIPCESQWCG